MSIPSYVHNATILYGTVNLTLFLCVKITKFLRPVASAYSLIKRQGNFQRKFYSCKLFEIALRVRKFQNILLLWPLAVKSMFFTEDHNNHIHVCKYIGNMYYVLMCHRAC